MSSVTRPWMLPGSFALLLLACGCRSWETRTYELLVQNRTADPIVVWLTKDGEPYEKGWFAPEDIAIESPKLREGQLSWTTIEPGQRQGIGPVKGRFASDTQAILRVYRNAERFSDLLSMSRGSPDRLDVPLRPGGNNLVIHTDAGSLEAQRSSMP